LEGIEIERSESAIGFEILAIVRDEKFAADEVDVGFNAGESVIEGVEKRAGVFVVIMRMGLGKGGRYFSSDGFEEKEECE
jgi:hypothetical protein